MFASTAALACAVVALCLRSSIFERSVHPERFAFKQRTLVDNVAPAGAFDFIKQGRTNAVVAAAGARGVSPAMGEVHVIITAYPILHRTESLTVDGIENNGTVCV